MPQLRESYTLPVERNIRWEGAFSSDTAEAAWATESIFFVRALHVEGNMSGLTCRVQISPDGMHWCDEGTTFELPTEADAVTFGRVTHFGGWLRVVGELPHDSAITVIVYLVLKG